MPSLCNRLSDCFVFHIDVVVLISFAPVLLS